MTTPATSPLREGERLAALSRYNVLDTPSEKDFDDLAVLASRICGAPMALMSLVDADRQWFKARVGVEITQTPRELAFCEHALSRTDPLIVPDAAADERFSTNPLVTGPPHIRFYAGAPLITPDGHALGTLCVLDSVPRQLTPEQTEALRALSHEVVVQLELRRTKTDLERVASAGKATEQALRESEEFKSRLIDCSRDCIKVLDLDGRLLSMNAGGMTVMEVCDFSALVNSVWVDFWSGEYKESAIAAVEKAKAGGVGRFVGPCNTQMGNPKWWDVMVSPILDNQGRVERVLSVSRDITEVKKAEQRNHTLLEINNALISNLTREELFHAICEAVKRVVPFDRVALTLYEPEAKVLRMAAFEGPFRSEYFSLGLAFDPRDSHVGHAFLTQQPLLRSDLEAEQEFSTEQRAVKEGIRSLCSLPLTAHGKRIGAINLASKVRNQYSRADAEFLGEVAKQIALAIENMEAYEEIKALKGRLEKENVYLQEEIRREHNFEEMVGNSPAIVRLLEKVEQVSATDATVLVLGETGTGKELIARAIHDRSVRKDRPLVKVNCGAIPAGLVESELFGHVKGAFTGALEAREGRFKLADGGTLFLDEVSELPLEAQVKLLRVLQEQEFEPVGSGRTIRVDVRIIAATNRSLNDAIRDGRFRADLFYRLNVFPLEVPALRERRSDIPQLAAYFLERSAKRFGKPVTEINQETMGLLKAYDWPGNIRELQNIIERGVVLSQGATLSLDSDLFAVSFPSVAGTPRTEQPAAKPSPTESAPATLGSLEEVQRNHILAALEESGGMIEGPRGAASILKLHPNTLRSRMQKLGIKRSRLKGA